MKNTNTSTTTETPIADDAVLPEFLGPRERASAAKVGGSFGADLLDGGADRAA